MCVFNKSLPEAGCLVIDIPVRLPQDVCQDRRQTEAPDPAGHVVIAYGRPAYRAPAYALTTGVARLDVV